MARQRKYVNSSVISCRISDEEMEQLNRMVTLLRMPRSDIMRLALGVVTSTPLETGETHSAPALPSAGIL